MGRLIDGDRLRKQMSEDYAQSVSKISNPTVKAIVEKAVETFDGYVVSAETVDAIPVKWIKEKIQSLRNENSYTSYHLSECFKALLIDWRRGKKIGPD